MAHGAHALVHAVSSSKRIKPESLARVIRRLALHCDGGTDDRVLSSVALTDHKTRWSVPRSRVGTRAGLKPAAGNIARPTQAIDDRAAGSPYLAILTQPG